MSDAGVIVLVRHGETEWSRAGRHTGVTDVPLTETGRAQARDLGPVLARYHLRARWSSPRSRALETATLAGIDPVEIEDDLVEWDYGRYEGLTSAQIHADDPGWTIWTGSTPGGETPAEVAGRADRVLARLDEARAAGDVAVFGHGHFTRALAARWIGLPVDRGASFLLDTAGVGVLGVDRGERALRRWNLGGG